MNNIFENQLVSLIENILTKTPIETAYRAKKATNSAGDVYPVCWDGQSFVYCGASDNAGLFCYFREKSETRLSPKIAVGENYVYNMEQTFNLVVCGKSSGAVSYDSMRAIMSVLKCFDSTGLTINAVYSDTDKLFDMEQNGKGVFFLPADLYIGFEFTAFKIGDVTDCQDGFNCDDAKHVFKKCDFKQDAKRNFSNDFNFAFS